MGSVAYRLTCLLVVLLAWTACNVVDSGYTKIGEVVKNPSLFDGKEVKIQGKVVDVLKLPLVETKFYTVKDETGELLVITSAASPGMGMEVRVKGSIDTMAILGGQSFGLHLKEVRRW